MQEVEAEANEKHFKLEEEELGQEERMLAPRPPRPPLCAFEQSQ